MKMSSLINWPIAGKKILVLVHMKKFKELTVKSRGTGDPQWLTIKASQLMRHYKWL